MGVVGLLARSDIRRSWRSMVALIVLVGAVGAFVLASVAGARRTDTSLDRFARDSRAADVELLGPDRLQPALLDDLRQVPGVEAVAVLRAYAVVLPRLPDLEAIGVPTDATFATAVDRARLVAGRAADPSVADEITIGEALATRLHLGVGDHLDAMSYTPAQIARILQGDTDVGPLAGPAFRLRISGVERRPLDLGDRAAAGGLLILTPAFDRAYAGRIGVFGSRLRLRTRHGAADAPRVASAARRIFGGSLFSTQGLAVETEGARDAINVLSLALWVLAGVATLAGTTALGIVLVRDMASLSSEQSTLSSLGITRGQRVVVTAPRTLLVAGGGTLLAVIGAIGASPLFPIGVARRAEPRPGVQTDWVVLVLGAVAVAVVAAAIGLLAVPGHQVGDSRLSGGSPRRALWRRRVL